MRVLGLMISIFVVVLYAQSHMKGLQLVILFKWDKSPLPLDSQIRLVQVVNSSLASGWGVVYSLAPDYDHDGCQPAQLGRRLGLRLT